MLCQRCAHARNFQTHVECAVLMEAAANGNLWNSSFPASRVYAWVVRESRTNPRFKLAKCCPSFLVYRGPVEAWRDNVRGASRLVIRIPTQKEIKS